MKSNITLIQAKELKESLSLGGFSDTEIKQFLEENYRLYDKDGKEITTSSRIGNTVGKLFDNPTTKIAVGSLLLLVSSFIVRRKQIKEEKAYQEEIKTLLGEDALNEYDINSKIVETYMTSIFSKIKEKDFTNAWKTLVNINNQLLAKNSKLARNIGYDSNEL
jgi:hypothetical protein